MFWPQCDKPSWVGRSPRQDTFVQFMPCCQTYVRIGRGCKDALRRVDQLLKGGYTYIVDADLKSYFDTIPHKRLMTLVGQKVSDGRILAILEMFLKQNILEDLQVWTPEMGSPQGAVITPPTMLQNGP